MKNKIIIVKDIQRKDTYKIIKKIAKENLNMKNYNICKNIYGKPYFTDEEIFFSISYCDDLMACIFYDSEIGIDIERIRDYNETLEDKVFNKFEERKEEKRKTFWEYWTIKESFLKYIGTGIKDELTKIRVYKNGKVIEKNNCAYYKMKKYNNYLISICSNKLLSEFDLYIYDVKEKYEK